MRHACASKQFVCHSYLQLNDGGSFHLTAKTLQESLLMFQIMIGNICIML